MTATAQWETLVARRMSGPDPYTYSAHRIERVDPPPGSSYDDQAKPERAMLHFRAGFAAASGRSFATDYSVGSAIPLRAYVAWQDQPEPPDREPLGRFPRIPTHCYGTERPRHADRAYRIRAARKVGLGFTIDEAQIRAAIRRHYLPAAADVLESLVRDVQDLAGIHSFEDWVDELGLEPPNNGRFAPWLRHWRAVYDRLVNIAPAVRAFFGEQWNEACELVRDL